MATKYRSCDSVSQAKTVELEKQGKELVATGTALKVSQSENKTLSGLLQNQKENSELLTQQYALDRKVLKRKLRKRNGVILIETIGLIGLILLL